MRRAAGLIVLSLRRTDTSKGSTGRRRNDMIKLWCLLVGHLPNPGIVKHSKCGGKVSHPCVRCNKEIDKETPGRNIRHG